MNLPISLPFHVRYYFYVQKQTSWGDLMRNSSENMQQSYRRTPMQKCDFNKFPLHQLLLKPGPRPWTWTQNPNPEKPALWKTWTLKNLDPEKPAPWKHAPWNTWIMKNVTNSWMQKKIGRPHSIIYYNTRILQEETCKWAIWKK